MIPRPDTDICGVDDHGYTHLAQVIGGSESG
jgi:hypothetical protein